jgi:N-alpha-acetyl-L-2,4-diaminobutyrate deacetylase
VEASSKSRVRCDIDFDKAGRQASYLRAPLSRNTSGWGTVEIPIVVVKNGTGPTVLFTGGVHGDEYEGLISVSQLARTLDPATIQGRVIMMPAVNVPAVLNDTRLSPGGQPRSQPLLPGQSAGHLSRRCWRISSTA